MRWTAGLGRRSDVRDSGSWIFQSTPMRSHVGDVGPRGSFRTYLLPRTEQCVLVRDIRLWAVRVLDRARATRSLHATAMSCQVEGAGPREMIRCHVSYKTEHRVSPRRPAAVPIRTHAARNDHRALEKIWPRWVAIASDRHPARTGLHPATGQLAAEVFHESTVWGAVPVSRFAAAIRAPGAALSAGQLPSGASERMHFKFEETLLPDGRSQGDALT